MDVITKRFETYISRDGCNCKNIWNICFLGELGFFLGENSSFPKEVAFFLGNFICSLGNIFAPWRTSIVP